MAELSVMYLNNHVIKVRSDSVDSGVEDTDDITNDISTTINATTPSSIKNVATVLGVYISLTISGLSHLDPKPLYLKKYKKSLKMLVDKILQENSLLFQRMIKSLKLTDKTSSRLAIRQVAKELFTDSQINWGRIVTLYAFVGELANYGEKSFAMDTKAGGYAKYIGEAVGEYVAEELTPWISKQGGWDRFVAYSKKEDSIEVKFLKGMLCTIFGIGIFATWKVMR